MLTWDCQVCDTNAAHKTCSHCAKLVHPWARFPKGWGPVVHVVYVCKCGKMRCADEDAGITTEAVLSAGSTKYREGECAEHMTDSLSSKDAGDGPPSTPASDEGARK